MRGPWTTLMNEAGNFEAGFWDQCGWWICDSLHDSSREAKDRAIFLNTNNVLVSGLPEKLARDPLPSIPAVIPPAPAPGQLIRLGKGFWVDPMDITRITPDTDGAFVVCRDGRHLHAKARSGESGEIVADELAAQVNAARLGGGLGKAGGEGGGANRSPSPKVTVPFAIACPYCGVEAGQECEDVSPGSYHLDRHEAAQRADS